MNESLLLKFSFIVSLIGLITLIFFSYANGNTNIKKLYLEEETIEIEGKITDIKKSGSATYLVIETIDKEYVTVFSNVSLNKGDYVIVEGRKDGDIIAEKITLGKNS